MTWARQRGGASFFFVTASRLNGTAGRSIAAAVQPTANMKRKADALSRIDGSDASGRGSTAGWTTCPLCEGLSKKVYALGRGIANHLHAVHTPWKPGKLERKKRQRLTQRQRTESKEHDAPGDQVEATTWDPTPDEVSAWETEVLRIVSECESTVPAGCDRDGKPATTYRESLPPFLQAARDGDLETLKRMVSESADVLNEVDRHGSLADHWAAGEGHVDCLAYLLTEREQRCLHRKQSTRRRDGKTALHYACRKGQMGCVRYLIEERKVDMEERSGDGTTPFHLACFGGHASIVQYLIEKGCNALALNDWGCGAAHWIGMCRSEPTQGVRCVCDALKRAGVDFLHIQKQGHSALHKAAQHKSSAFIDWFLENVDDVAKAMRADDGGHTPLDIWLRAGGDRDYASKLQKYMSHDCDS